MTKEEKRQLIELVENVFLARGREPNEKMVIFWCKELMGYEFREVKRAINDDIQTGNSFIAISNIIKNIVKLDKPQGMNETMSKEEFDRKVRGY